MLVTSRSIGEETAASRETVFSMTLPLAASFLICLSIGKQQSTAAAKRKMLLKKDILSCKEIKPLPPKPNAVFKNVPSLPKSSK